MEMQLPITLEKVIAKVKLAPSARENLHAFGELEVYEEGKDEPLFKVKGWTIRTKVFGEKKVLTVVPPAYPGGGKFLTSFYIDNKNLWQDITKLFLNEYAQVSGGLSAQESDEIDMDEVEAGIEKMNQERDKQW